MVTSLPRDSRYDSRFGWGFFPIGEIFHGLFKQTGVSVFHCLLSMLCCLHATTIKKLTINQGRPSGCVVFLFMIQSNLLHYRAMACRSVVIEEVEP